MLGRRPDSGRASKEGDGAMNRLDELQALSEMHWEGHGFRARTGEIVRAPDISFNGYSFYGYIGHPDRNYLSDRWVAKASLALGWSVTELGEWMLSRWGRWALDSQPLRYGAMRDQMANCDMAALMGEAFEDLAS